MSEDERKEVAEDIAALIVIADGCVGPSAAVARLVTRMMNARASAAYWEARCEEKDNRVGDLITENDESYKQLDWF